MDRSRPLDTGFVASDANGSDSDIFVRDVGPRGDLNGDGCVDGEDLGNLLLNWGECQR